MNFVEEKEQKMKKRKLLDANEDEEDEHQNETPSIQVNKEYVKKFNQRKRKEELSNLKTTLEQLEDDEESESEEEDEHGVERDNPEWEDQFYKVLPLIASKDPSIYHKEKDFFPEVLEASEENPPKKKKEKKLTVQQYIVNTLLETEGKGLKEDKELQKLKKNKDLSYVEEQEMLKKSIRFGDEKEEKEEEEFFSLRKKSKKELAADEENFLKFQSSEEGKKIVKETSKKFDEMELLQAFWKARELDENENFLRDYILNKRWIESNDIPTYDELIEQEDEEALEKQDEFEAEYNFRNVHQEEIVGYPRAIENSTRRPNEKRKEKREKLKERKEQERLKKEEVIKRLKNLKKQEISEKLKLIHDLTGNPNLSIEDLEKDWDPEEYDSKFQYDVDQMNFPFEEGEDDEENEENEEYGEEDEEKDEENYNNIIEGKEEEEDTTEANEENEEGTKSTKKVRSAFKKVKELAKTKKEINEILEEYYKLNYEDLIGGEIPTRFKYTEVPKENFGLTLEEILETDDKELNRRVPLRYYAPYRTLTSQDKKDLKKRKYVFKGGPTRKKRKLSTEDQTINNNLTNNNNTTNASERKKKKRKRKKNKNKKQETTSKTN